MIPAARCSYQSGQNEISALGSKSFAERSLHVLVSSTAAPAQHTKLHLAKKGEVGLPCLGCYRVHASLALDGKTACHDFKKIISCICHDMLPLES